MPVPVRVFLWVPINQLIEEYFPNIKEGEYSHSNCYESIILQDESLTLPSKEAFETKLLEKLNDDRKEVISGILRQARKADLSTSDYMFNSDYTISEEKKQVWAEYRQKLRDLTKDLSNVYFNNNFELVNLELPVDPNGNQITLDYEIPRRTRI